MLISSISPRGRRRGRWLGLATTAAMLVAPIASASAAPVSSHSPMFCSSPQLMSDDYFDVLITGDRPDTLHPGGTIAVNNARLQIIVGVKGVNILTNILGANSISGSVTRFDVATTNATPGIVDLAAGAPMSFGPQPITVGQPLTVDVTPRNAIIGPFTASSPGLLSLSTGHVDIVAHISSPTNPFGNQNLTISCDQGLPVPFVLTSVAQPASAAAGPKGGNVVSAQSTRTRRLRRLKMVVTGVSTKCSVKRARRVRVRVKNARGGVREVVVRVNGRVARRQDVSGRRMTIRLKEGKRRQRMKIRATDESGRSVTLRRTLCLR